MCQKKKAGLPNAELVNDFSLETEVRDVTYKSNKMVKHKSLLDQELSDRENDPELEVKMDRSESNSQVGHGDQVGEARGRHHPRC